MTGPGIPVKLESGAAELLRLLREPGGATRAELMDRTGWSRATVAQHLEGLLRSHLVISVGEAESTGGRPATRLAFDGSAAVVLAACVGETRAHVAIVDLAGRLVVTEGMDHRVATGPLPPSNRWPPG
jgi:predicted ArsR family transcriptional regulator